MLKEAIGITRFIYNFLSFLLTGIYNYPIEQYLYLVNFAVILVALPSLKDNFEFREGRPLKWLLIFVVMVVIIALLALIAINSHGELKGTQVRFL